MIDTDPAYYMKEEWGYNSHCYPIKFIQSSRSNHGNGYDYHFDHVSLSSVNPDDVKTLFFDKYPNGNFYEEESSGQRKMVNLPSAQTIKDVYGAYSPKECSAK